MPSATEEITRADVCVIAMAECFRGDGEILANPTVGTCPVIGGRLARLSFEPDLLLTDGEAMLVANALPVSAPVTEKVIEHWNPYRSMFDVVWSGRRHVVMGATQIDRFGNQNIAAIGDYFAPKAMLLGFRGAPGNTINHVTSYWVPRHAPNVFIEHVDTVCGIGYDRAAALPGDSGRWHEIRYVVSNLGVFDFGGPDHAMRVHSLHPGVTVQEVIDATGFELAIPADVPESRLPTDEERQIIDQLDPKGARHREVPNGDGGQK